VEFAGECHPQAVVTSLATIETSYVKHITKGIQGFDHPDYPALMMATTLLDIIEGQLWVIIVDQADVTAS
jgi:hypothetical protein